MPVNSKLTAKTSRLCCSGPSKQRVASGCTMVHAVLTAVLEWANYPPVISASVDCLKTTLHYLNTGAAPSSYACFAHTPPCVTTSLCSCDFRGKSAVWVQPDNDLPSHMRLYVQNALHDKHNMMSHASTNICQLTIQFSCYSQACWSLECQKCFCHSSSA